MRSIRSSQTMIVVRRFEFDYTNNRLNVMANYTNRN